MNDTNSLDRNSVDVRYTWNTESVFSSDDAWRFAVDKLVQTLKEVPHFEGNLGKDPETLAVFLGFKEKVVASVLKIRLYATMRYTVDTRNQTASELRSRASALISEVKAAFAFSEPEILAIGLDKIKPWVQENDPLSKYKHYFDMLAQKQMHIRSADVEELLGRLSDPFNTTTSMHSILTDAEMQFQPAKASDSSETFAVEQGTIGKLLSHEDREVRRTAWENYADAHLAFKNTMANCIAAGVKQNVFMMRTRKYDSSLEAALSKSFIPTSVFYNLIDTFKSHLPTWHRYWRLRKKVLGLETMHVYDVKAPLTENMPQIEYDQVVDWVLAGVQPLGDEYGSIMAKGLKEDRWVDVFPNRGKRMGAFSLGVQGTNPFILMSHSNDIFGLSTLAHELGHSMHTYYSCREQPFVYSDYSLFVAEVASNFNQALVRKYLLDTQQEKDFQIAVIEEAMANFFRYFFIMPTLARFELAIHQRVEQGEGLTADGMIDLLAGFFQEGYADEVEIDKNRVGIIWAQFATHLYANFYVYQYATGISGAHALAHRVLSGTPGAVNDYLAFLKAGGSRYPLDILKEAGVDLSTPEPVEKTFAEMAEMISRLETLLT